MLGFGKRSAPQDDRLPVLVQVVQNNQTFTVALKIWQENIRAVRYEPSTRKEFLRFGLVQTGQALWFERDHERADCFELIMAWNEGSARFADIYVITPNNVQGPSGDAEYVGKVLEALLTTPATLPVDKSPTA